MPQEQKPTSEQGVAMAESLPNITQEMEQSMAKELAPESNEQSQEVVMIEEALDRASRSMDRQKLNTKAAGSAAGQSIVNVAATWPKKLGTQVQRPKTPSEPSHEDVKPQEYRGTFQGMRLQYECNPQADVIAETGVRELYGLEIEAMRRQMYMITDRLNTLENQVTTWRYKGAVFFTVLVSACMVKLWQWLRH